MRNFKVSRLVFIMSAVFLFSACERNEDPGMQPEISEGPSPAVVEGNKDLSKSGKVDQGFVHGLVVDIDGADYYFAGAPDGPDGSVDVPGHYWVQTGPDQLVGKHYNTGPFETPLWWSSDAENGELLYMVKAVIDEWTMEKAKHYASKGFVHYHEFVSVDEGELHPHKVVWLKHTAVTSFTLDGGPGAPNPPYEHYVTPGVDLQFPNNYMQPYDPDDAHDH